MNLSFSEIDGASDQAEACAFLTGSCWPFHGRSRLSIEQALNVTLGPSSEVRAFWIREEGAAIGLVRLLDLGDAEEGSVQFDLRIAEAHRGRGVGRRTIAWLTDFLFESYPKLHRIEAATRIDNHAMHKALERNAYRLEGRLRETWRSDEGVRYDTALYGRLRTDAP